MIPTNPLNSSQALQILSDRVSGLGKVAESTDTAWELHLPWPRQAREFAKSQTLRPKLIIGLASTSTTLSSLL